jgi:hypothetical protein
MMREVKAHPHGLLAVRCLTMAALGCRRPDRCMRAGPGLARAGLIVGILMLVLPSVWGSLPSPDVPSMVECMVMSPPPILAFGWGKPSVVSPLEARQTAMGPQVSAPYDTLMRDDCDLYEDDPSPLPMLIRGVLYLPPSFARMRVTQVTAAVPWPFPYLARPQLLTRSLPLPSGRENPCLS